MGAGDELPMREAPAHHRDRLSELPAPRCAAVFVRGRVCSSLSHAAARVLQTAVPRAEALPLLRPSAARMARAAPRAAALAAVKNFRKIHRKAPPRRGLFAWRKAVGNIVFRHHIPNKAA